MKVAIVPNPTREAALECSESVLEILTAHGCGTVLKRDLFDSGGAYHEAVDDSVRDCDMFIAIGGDGTIIHTAKLAASLDKPILGINAGSLGFTAGLERNELALLSKLPEGGYVEEKRLMLSVTLISGGKERKFLALNDAVVAGESTKIINYNMALGNDAGYSCRADGFIAATPTGSTAYSLSAGGPVIQPDMQCLVYTPICPHSLVSRSVVFGGDTRLAVSIPKNNGRLFLTVDGEAPIELKQGGEMYFERAERQARFIRLGESNFYDALNKKIIQTS